MSLVVAIVLLGDPSHNPNATYNKGTSKNEGVRLLPNCLQGLCKLDLTGSNAGG